MAPRVGAAASGLGDPNFKFLLSVVKHCEQIKTDWNEVAKENGIAYARNAAARFKSIMEQNGLKFENGAITVPGGACNGVAAVKASATANEDDKPKPSKRAKKTTTTTTTSRKRKVAAADGDEATAPAAAGSVKKGGAKKKMRSEPLVKVDEDDDEVDSDDAGTDAKNDAKGDGGDKTGDETCADEPVKAEEGEA